MISLKSHYGLIFRLLFAIKIGGNKATWIMNEIKTPRKVTSELLSGMMGSGFIECISEKKNKRVLMKQYHITTKGNQLYESLMLSQGVEKYNQQNKLEG